jgi:hypothetical protein
MRSLLTSILILISSFTFGQDWCAWSFKFKFKINTEETIRYEYKNMEVFINDKYTYEMLQGSELKFDTLTKDYSLFLNYGCISCGYPNSDLPPEIYVKVNLEYPRFGAPFSTIIPIYFRKSNTFSDTQKLGSDLTIELGKIAIKHFLNDNHWKDNEETFEIIEVISINSIHYRKAGQYSPRSMNRLIKVEQ